METISLKLDENLLNNIDKSIKKHNFSTRTEFIRDAIREKLEKMSREELIRHLFSFYGKSKRRISEAEYRKAREEAFGEFVKEKGWD